MQLNRPKFYTGFALYLYVYIFFFPLDFGFDYFGELHNLKKRQTNFPLGNEVQLKDTVKPSCVQLSDNIYGLLDGTKMNTFTKINKQIFYFGKHPNRV